MNADDKTHWDTVYRTKEPDAVSWYRPHLERSLALIKGPAPDLSASIIDIGGGESTLVDDLLAGGYRAITVLDISPATIDVSKKRLGGLAQHVIWLTADIPETKLPKERYDVWHDRGVFHFLTRPEQRDA